MIRTLKKIKITIIPALLCLLLSGSVYAQDKQREIVDDEDLFEVRLSTGFDFDFSTFLEPRNFEGDYELNVFTRIPYFNLQFLKFELVYRAQYEIIIQIFDDQKTIVDEISWIETIQTRKYEETSDPGIFHLTRSSISIPSGKHSVQVNIEDINSGKSVNKIRVITIPEEDDLYFKTSNILIVEDYTLKVEGVADYIPSVTDSLYNSEKSFYAYFEILPSAPQVNYTIDAALKSNKKEGDNTIIRTNFELLSRNDPIPVIFNLNDNKLEAGDYTVTFDIILENNIVQTLEKSFYIGWYSAPDNENDLNLIFDQIKYIYNRAFYFRTLRTTGNIFSRYLDLFEDVFKEIIYAKKDELSLEEKLDMFNYLWYSLDPTPGTEINEKRDEFLRRIDYTIEKFARGSFAGWKTDLGVIYILFGTPDYIYENGITGNLYWKYYNKEIILRFYDKHGFKDYDFIQTLPIDTPIR
ncbi:MAG: GWxTD domain-containing protein [bacterium]|nr:GWxTD domain-containing protein [bacterium]